MMILYLESPKKPDIRLAWKVFLVELNFNLLKDFIRSIHYKEGDCHDDINDEES